VIFAGIPLSSGDVGQIIDDGYNRYSPYGSNGNINVTSPASSIAGVMPLFNLPDVVKWGIELPRADVFGWSDRAPTSVRFSGGSATGELDWRGRTARPWGGGPSIGYVEAPDLTQDTSSAITSGGTNSLKLVGAGEHWPIDVALDGNINTITVVTKSTSYGGTNYPQLVLEANPAISLAAQTATATSASEQTLTLSGLSGISGAARLRLVSRSSSTTSVTYFDLLAGA
jgi:hypothetical protein